MERAYRWFIVQARSNFEKSVAQSIRDRIVTHELQEEFGQILVPSEEVVEMKDGQKRKSDRKFFPGYVLVEIAVSEDSGLPRISNEAWHLVKETNKVSGFIGGTADRPLPISQREAESILSRVAVAADKPAPKQLYEVGQMIRVTEGPFNDFNGVVEAIDYDKATLRVSVLLFGRGTPVDLAMSQVETA